MLKIELDESVGGIELINFVDLTLKEKLMILNWRNNDNVKNWMYSSDPISIENHIRFIDGLFFSKIRKYMVVKKDNSYVGVIYFTEIDFVEKSIYFGLYANPFKKIPGVGTVLVEECLKYVFGLLKFKKIKLEVFSNNIQAVRLYNKFNFKKTGQKSVNEKVVICMELSQ